MFLFYVSKDPLNELTGLCCPCEVLKIGGISLFVANVSTRDYSGNISEILLLSINNGGLRAVMLT